MEYYVQCEFKSGDAVTTAWIPEEAAKVGYSMVFKDEGGKARWTVTEVYSSTKLLKRDLDSKRHNVFGSIK